MYRNPIKALLLFSLMVVIFLGVLSPIAKAAVLWDSSSLTSVYDPQGNLYTYAPTVVRDGNTEHMWTCHNAEDGVIRDNIYYTKRVNGVVTESRSVLGPGPNGAWDSFHVCDPAVLAGKFNFEGTVYDYAMFYLGNDIDGVTHNQIGVAFSNDLEGNWIRYPQPIVTYPNDGFWGVGQPSATSVDGQGHLLLFFTKGDPQMTAGYRIEMNLSDMANPVIGAPLHLTDAGLKDINGNQDWFNNFDITYDPTRDRFFAVRDVHPFPSNTPNFISTSVQIVSIAGGSVWGGGGEWKVEGTLNAAVTGFPRNHNAGLLRTVYGILPNPNQVEVYFADSDAAPDLVGKAEFTYDIWTIKGELNNADPLTTIEINKLFSKQLEVHSLVTNLNTNVTNLNGTTSMKDRDLWVGYRIFNQQGYLLEAGTAFKDRINQDGSFSIPFLKPIGIHNEEVRLEVYLLSAKGKSVESVSGKVEM
jgi:hypothetical protein